ncbi:MAG: glycerophosphodiester phosphodiesterase [Janthinobacterium lividum]
MNLLPRRCLAVLAATVLTSIAVAAQAFDLQAHRGGRGLWPENTLAAFDKAVTLGVDTLELDVAMTADDVLVVSHDIALNPDHTRDANNAWLPAAGPLIRSLTFAQLQAYDIGRIRRGTDYARQFAYQSARDGERIPTLSAVFSLVRDRGANAVRFNIETKTEPGRPDDTASPDALVRALLAEIDRAGMADRVTIQSFDWRTLALVGQRAPKMPRAYLTTARTLRDRRWTDDVDAAAFASTPQLVKAAAGASSGPVVWSPASIDATPTAIREAKSLGLQVIPWTVNKRNEMNGLIELGVDGLITDYPNALRDVLQSNGMALPAAYPRRDVQ